MEPSASRVAEVLLRQQDPMNWSDEMWEADSSIDFLPMPPLPVEVFEFINRAQRAAEKVSSE